MKRYMRLQLYLAGTFLFVSLFLFIFVYIYAVQQIRGRQERMLELELDTTEAEVQLFFADFMHAIEDTSSYITAYGTSNLYDYLVMKQSHHESLSSIYYGTVDNVMINSSGFIPPVGFDLRTRIWYTMAVEQGEPIITPIFLNATQDHLIATIAAPLYINDELQGVVAADIWIDTIKDYVRVRQIGQSGYALLIDSNLNVVAYPTTWNEDEDILHAFDLGLDWSDIEENIVHVGIELHDVNGAMIYTDVIMDDYTLLIFMPADEFLSTQKQFRNYFIVVFILINIIGLTYILYNRRYIIEPLKHFYEDLSQIDIRDNIHHRLPVDDRDGFLEIKKSLNRSLDSAEAYFIENNMNAKALHLENQRFKLLIDSTQDFIIQLDLNHRIISAYGKGLSKIDMHPHLMINQTIHDIFPDNKISLNEIIDSVLKGEHKLYDWELHIQGQRLIYETSVSPIYDQHDEIIGAVSISRDITEPMKKQEEIEYINVHDYLTGLYNRRAFQDRFDQLNKHNKFPMSIMMLDLNGLKLINDAFGHLQGDLALQKVADVLAHRLQNHFVARIGGDEFAAIVTGLTDQEINRIKDQITDDVSRLSVTNMPLSISAGYEIIHESGHDFNEVMNSAENNMYRHKITESMSVRNNAIKAIHKTLTDKYRDERIHSEKVSQLCYVIGLALDLNADSLKELKLAGMYHDIGKIAIPDAILDKPDVLTNEEYEIMKTHTELGYNILRAADEYSRLAEYALTHHERWDGKGYPRGLKGEEIPLFSRIINLADSFDAMTSNRSYRSKMGKDKAIQEIIKHAGHQFDPMLAKVFVEKVLKRPWNQ